MPSSYTIPVTPSSEELLKLNMAQIKPSLESQARQYQQMMALREQELAYQQQAMRQAQQQFTYANPPWQQRQAAAQQSALAEQQRQAMSYLQNQFPQHLATTPVAAAPVNPRLAAVRGQIGSIMDKEGPPKGTAGDLEANRRAWEGWFEMKKLLDREG